jgi:hypothetical protein
MNSDVAWLVYEGALAVREGRRDDAQGLLLQAIERDERNEQAWMWLSGAMVDPADQQIALENVLLINPNNQVAKEGLKYLTEKAASQTRSGGIEAVEWSVRQPTSEPWTPPQPLDPDEVLELSCWQCSASLYSVAQFCWKCHAPVHACNNCVFLPEPRCKELQELTSTLSQAAINRCEWWRPKQ